MRYRLTCLTPLLVGDGRKLSPIDYMVWKDQVNVLDQRRIFRLLSKGPRLDGYLTQLKRAEKLDFASWGGFAQNFADRRIPFEHASCAAHWGRSPAEGLHIPTFASGPQGPYLPGSALKGALRTGMLYSGMKDGRLEKVAAQFEGERPPRRPAELLEDRTIGAGGASRMRVFQPSDSEPISAAGLKVYMLRVASLVTRRQNEGLELGWKQSPRGTASGARPQEGTATFAEMACPGTVFEGNWNENGFLKQPEVQQSLNWREPADRSTLLEAANLYSGALLESQKRYCEVAGLPLVRQSLERLETTLSEARGGGNACLLCLGWGGGLLARVAWLKTEDPVYRRIIEQSRLYRAAYQGLPFPKTRRIIFLGDQPAALPGWGLLEVLP